MLGESFPERKLPNSRTEKLIMAFFKADKDMTKIKLYRHINIS